MSQIPKLKYIYDRYKKASIKKKASVELRITYDRKQKYISTGISLYPKEWKGTVVNNPEAQLLNQQLDNFLIDVRQVIIDMGDDIDIFRIPQELNKKKERSISFLQFCKQRAEIRKYGKSDDTKERYDRFIKYFSLWGKIQRFDDVTEANIILYDKYLAGKGMKLYSKWNNYHRFLNSFIMDAVDAGYMKRNPYKWVNIEKDKDSSSLAKCLSIEEFYDLKNTKMPSKCLERVRDLFVFQTYTCLSYRDLKYFDVSKLIRVKGMKVYTGKREKTGKAFTIPMMQPALKILKKYDNKLPLLSNVKYNEYLKVVAQAAGISRPVSTHWARHTGATLLLNEGVPMQIVSRICGHASTKITEQVYAKLFDETVVDAIKGIKI